MQVACKQGPILTKVIGGNDIPESSHQREWREKKEFESKCIHFPFDNLAYIKDGIEDTQTRVFTSLSKKTPLKPTHTLLVMMIVTVHTIIHNATFVVRCS